MSKGGSTDLEQAKVKKILDQCLKQDANRLCAEWYQTGGQGTTRTSRRESVRC